MAAFTTPYCGEDRALAVRFANHFRMLTQDDPGAHDENALEKIGDLLAYPSVHLPGLIRRACKDPRVLTVALGALAMLADSYLFYPKETHECIKQAITYLNFITLERARFAGWVGSLYQIAAVTTRALGRAFNSEYMDQFYQSGQEQQHAHQQ